MSLLHNKRKRNDSSNYSSTTLFKDNLLHFKNGLDNINNNENILGDNISNNNINKNNSYDLFQKLFNSINSRTEAINQNNIIMSPLFRSSIFFGSFQKIKSFDKIVSNDKSKKFVPKLNSSVLKNKLSSSNKNKIFSPFSSFKLEKNLNYNNGFGNNNYDKLPLRLDFGQINFSEKKNIFELNSEKKNYEDNESDILGNSTKNLNNVFGNPFLNKNNNNNSNNSNSNNKQNSKNLLNIQKGDIFNISNNKDFIGTNPINTSLFVSKNKKVNKSYNNMPINKNKKIINKKISNSIIISKPFQTYNAKMIKKKYKNDSLKPKVNKPKIFHIEKIYNKKEYKDAHEKKEKEDNDINMINRYKISLKKIKQIYLNSCLKIYSYINNKSSFNESDLNNKEFITQLKNVVYDIIKSKKITSSKMNEILQVNDDDKYRKHYFMFSSEAKQFCLDLINKKNFSFDIVMKMCKVPRKSLRRWSYVGCNRKKGCGRKTKNPEMEEKLVDWYNDIIKNETCVTAKMIREKAVEISSDKEFLASKGWFEKFKRKFNIKIVSNKNKKYRKILGCEKSKNIINLKEEEDDNIDYEINIIKNNNDIKKVKEEKNEQAKQIKFKKLLFVKM